MKKAPPWYQEDAFIYDLLKCVISSFYEQIT